MKFSQLIIAGAAGAMALIGTSASATVMEYTFTGVGSGLYNDGPTSTPFSGLSFSIVALGDTTTLVDHGGVYIGLQLISAKIYAMGKPEDLPIGSNEYLNITEGTKHPGVLFIGNPPYPEPFQVDSPLLVGYSPLTAIGPISVRYDGGLDPTLSNGADLAFSTVTGATFTAGVPEPGAWALMLLGLGGVGAAIRLRRRRALSRAAPGRLS